MPGKEKNSFYNCLLNTYYEPGMVQEAVNKTGKKDLSLWSWMLVWEEGGKRLRNK